MEVPRKMTPETGSIISVVHVYLAPPGRWAAQLPTAISAGSENKWHGERSR